MNLFLLALWLFGHRDLCYQWLGESRGLLLCLMWMGRLLRRERFGLVLIFSGDFDLKSCVQRSLFFFVGCDTRDA